MNPERWRQIESLYHAVLECEPDRRGAYLAEACSGDAGLRSEVEALLEKGDDLDSLLEKSSPDRQRFGPYTTVEKLGAGGMGEVYKAFDKRLNRTVAIKVLNARFSDRFLREARAIAALNHPGICTLYDVGEDYLVMELVEGKPLSGPLPLNQMLRLTEQICDALDAAHRAGIVHRDLKPSNILVTKQGIKLLDFGIARMMSGEETQTAAGCVIGTPAYMAPEVLKGQPADVRSDIYSLGCVLHEVATGARPGPRALEPPGLERVVRTCLAEDPDDRWQSARDVKLAIEMVRQPAPALRKQRPWVWVGVTSILAVFAVLAGWMARPPAHAVPYRFTIDPPEGWQFHSSAISPDATMLAFAASTSTTRQLWIRRLDSLQDRPLPDTTGASQPFWSPDNRRVAFFAQDKLKAIDLGSGMIQSLCDAEGGGGGGWSEDGVLLFAKNRVIHQVSAAGGVSRPVTRLNLAANETSHGAPWFLPDGRHFLFTITYSGPSAATIHVASLDAPDDRRRVMEVDAGRVAYASPPQNGLWGSPGHLLFMRGGVLMAQALDVRRIEPRGEPFPVAENVFAFSVSSGGAIATRSFPTPELQQLVWRDRRGKEMGLVGDPGRFGQMSLSPDGTRLAQPVLDPATGETDIWVRDLQRGTTSKLLSAGPDFNPVWSPDGGQLVFGFGGLRAHAPLFRRASLSAERESLGVDGSPTDWSKDGRFLLLEVGLAGNTYDLQVLEPGKGDRKPVPFADSPSASEEEGRFSPESVGPPRWIAYTLSTPGQREVHVQSFTPGKRASGESWKVSISGGRQPRWRADGKELFYRDGGKIMGVLVETGATGFRASTPVTLFEGRPGVDYVVANDGSRFLLSEVVPGQKTAPPPPVTVTLNWQALLR